MRHAVVVALLASLLLVAVLTGCTRPPDEDPHPEASPSDPAVVAFHEALAGDRHAVFTTDHGEIRLHLYESMMPVTTARFIELVESGFYDGTTIHRNVERFVIQGGDPTGTGLGGSLESIPHERHEALLFGHGALGLARSLDEDSGDSQWFITLTPQPHLSDPDSDTAEVFGTYSLYGQVVEGMPVVRSINQAPTIPGLDRPVEPPVVHRAEILDPPGGADLLGLVRTISERVTIGGHGVDVDRPLHLFTGRPFEVGVYLRPGDEEDPPPQEVQVRYRSTVEGEEQGTPIEEVYTLEPVEGDPWSFTGTALLQSAGDWEERVQVGGETGRTDRIEVHPWHEDYRRFSG